MEKLSESTAQAIASHMLGLDEAKYVFLNRKRTALYYRNYYSGQNDVLDRMEQAGLVIASRQQSRENVVYHLTDEGISWLADRLDIAIYDRGSKLPEKKLSDSDVNAIRDFWTYVQNEEILVESVNSGWSMKVVLYQEQVEAFCGHFGIEDDTEVAATLSGGMIVIDMEDLASILFNTYNPFQLEAMRPEGTIDCL